MKIRTKISLLFALLTGLSIAALGLLVFILTKQFINQNFNERLLERVLIAEQVYLEEDEMNTQLYKEVLSRFLQKLPEESSTLLKVDITSGGLLTQDTGQVLSSEIINKILLGTPFFWSVEERKFAGILFADNTGDYIVVVSAVNQFGKELLYRLAVILSFSILLLASFSFLSGIVFAGKILYPFSEIIEKMKEITASNLHLRLPKRETSDEIGLLTDTFNNMLDRLELSFEVQSSFISNASHELKNPLAAILGQSEITLLKPRSQEEYIISIEKIKSEAERLDKLTRALLQLASTSFSSETIKAGIIDLDELIIEIKETIEFLRPGCRIDIVLEPPAENQRFSIDANASILTIALSNLIENACKFSSNQPVKVALQIRKKSVLLSIKDLGVGIPPDEITNIFLPFFRGSNVRKLPGFGIGLPLAEKILRLHKAEIKVSSQINSGTTFLLKFPLAKNGLS